MRLKEIKTLKVIRLENEIKSNKNKLDVNNLRENHKEFIKKQKFNITILVKI